MPAAVAVLPVPAAKSTNYIWIIAVVVGACLLIFIVAACIYWRWKVGGPQRGKLDIEEISMTEKKKDAEKGVVRNCIDFYVILRILPQRNIIYSASRIKMLFKVAAQSAALIFLRNIASKVQH